MTERVTDFGILRTHKTDGYTRIANFSYDLLYRYTLEIKWEDRGKTINFLMLNPSTADEMKNDPTVARCERRARSWGYSGVIITNVFAFRSTNPKVLYSIEDPVGKHNDALIGWAAMVSECTICAWGLDGKLKGRDTEVRRIVPVEKAYYLRLSKNGIPCHPLYLPYSLEPKEWW